MGPIKKSFTKFCASGFICGRQLESFCEAAYPWNPLASHASSDHNNFSTGKARQSGNLTYLMHRPGLTELYLTDGRPEDLAGPDGWLGIYSILVLKRVMGIPIH